MIPTVIKGKGSKVTELPKNTTVFFGICKQGEMRFVCPNWDLKFNYKITKRVIPSKILGNDEPWPDMTPLSEYLNDKEKNWFANRYLGLDKYD